MEAVISPWRETDQFRGRKKRRMWHCNISGRGASLLQGSIFSTCCPFRGQYGSVTVSAIYIFFFFCVFQCPKSANSAQYGEGFVSLSAAKRCVIHSASCSFGLSEMVEGFPDQIPSRLPWWFSHQSSTPLLLTMQRAADSMSPPSTTYTASSCSISKSQYVRRKGGTFTCPA